MNVGWGSEGGSEARITVEPLELNVVVDLSTRQEPRNLVDPPVRRCITNAHHTGVKVPSLLHASA